MTTKQRIGAFMTIICLILGAVGCMHTKAGVQKEMLNYLEDKYGETFEVEYFDKGDFLFPEIYGGDKMLVYPTSNPNIPFYVYKNVESEGFYDIYVPSYFSYQFTQKHQQNLMNMDTREKAFKVVLTSRNRPAEARQLQRTIEDFVQDTTYRFNLHLYVAVKKEGEPDADTETEFLYQLYTYMNELKNEGAEVYLGVAYVEPERFEEAQSLMRLAHTINFAWYLLDDEDVLNVAYFGSTNDIQDNSYFMKFFNDNEVN